MRKSHFAGLLVAVLLVLVPTRGQGAELSGELHEQLQQAMDQLRADADWRAALEKPAARERNRTEFVVVGGVSEVVLLNGGVAILFQTNPLVGSTSVYPYTVLCVNNSPAYIRCLGARRGARYRASGFLFPMTEDGEPVSPYIYNSLGVMAFTQVR